MIRWIQSHPWHSSISLAAFSLFIFGGIDVISIGLISLSIAFCNSLAVLVAREYRWLSSLLLATSAALAITFEVRLGASGGIALLALGLVSAFGTKVQRFVALGVAAISGIALLWFSIFGDNFLLSSYGVSAMNQGGQWNIFLFGSLLIISVSTLAWLVGRLLITRATHVGTNFDRAISDRIQASQALDIAEQEERFGIARDISELVIQRVSATISLAEGGIYATNADPEVGSRILQQVADSARSGHQELRRLYDMLNNRHEIAAAPPKIDDIEALVIAFRQTGYNITSRHEGLRFKLNEGAELAIYRIVFDALENIRKHAPIGTDITIDFAWTDSGLQVLVKDNGVELCNRGLTLEELSYSIDQDRQALVENIVGAGITAMGERARLYGGTIEATRVPGVGFTLSAIFPDLRQIAQEN